MIVEVRTYRIKSGQRARFLELFAQRTVPLQQRIGMRILGPLLDLEDPDVFVWIRAFPSQPERERMIHALYQGDEWQGELRALALPLLDSYTVTVTELPHGFINELPGRMS
jgi:hypothetical protein